MHQTKEYQKPRSVATHKSESKPSDLEVQGASKVDSVTVWFMGLNVKLTISPGDAL